MITSKFTIIHLLLCMMISCTTKKIGEKIEMTHIIPRPHTIESRGGIFLLDAKTQLRIDETNPELNWLATYFNQILSLSSNFHMETENESDQVSGSNIIYLKLNKSKDTYGKEGYHLSVKSRIITVTAAAPAGIFYGLQSLRQLFPVELENYAAKRDLWKIPCAEIDDKPRFTWRGQMLDVSRHFLSLDLIKKNIDYLARYKMNTFHWHLTDDQGWRLEIKKYPKLTEIGAWRVDRNDEAWWGREPAQPGEKATYGGYYSQEEIRDIVKYARQRFITIVPEIDMPGHSQATIAAYPEISCDGGSYSVATGGVASGNTLCPGKEITFEFIDNVLDEVFEMFSMDYFHIGGDECNKEAWKVCPDCQKRIADEELKNEDELQSYFIRRVEKLVNARGKKLIGWDEILEGGLAPNATVMSWRGEKGGVQAAREGHDVVMTPTAHCYLDLKQGDPQLEPELGYSRCWLSEAYGYDPVPSELTPEQAQHILGSQGNLWGESIQNESQYNYMLFPRLLAIAEVTWTPKESRHWDDFVHRLEINMQRLDHLGVGYARSMYNVAVDVMPQPNGHKFDIVLKTEHGQVPIHYTLDGEEPTPASPIYDQPVRVSKTTMIKAGSFRNNTLLNKITERALIIHLAAGLPVDLKYPWNDRYPPANDRVLTDCMRGSLDYKDQKWMGFEGDDLIALIDFAKPTPISKVIVGTMENQDHFIFLPKEVEILMSPDGKSYQSLGQEIIDSATRHDTDAQKDITVSFDPVETRYLRIQVKNLAICPDWHPGSGHKAWLFVDELFVD